RPRGQHGPGKRRGGGEGPDSTRGRRVRRRRGKGVTNHGVVRHSKKTRNPPTSVGCSFLPRPRRVWFGRRFFWLHSIIHLPVKGEKPISGLSAAGGQYLTVLPVGCNPDPGPPAPCPA